MSLERIKKQIDLLENEIDRTRGHMYRLNEMSEREISAGVMSKTVNELKIRFSVNLFELINMKHDLIKKALVLIEVGADNEG